MSILQGLTLVAMPVAELAGGHIFEVAGYGAVYIVSLCICTCGLLYVMVVIPSQTNISVERRDSIVADESTPINTENDKKETKPKDDSVTKKSSLLQTIRKIITKGNRTIVESYR